MKPYVLAAFLAAFLAASLSLVSAAQAQQETFTINPAASKIAFSLAGNTHHVEGTFKVQNGTVEFGPGPGAMSGSIVVSAASGDSGDKGRDRDMDKKVLQTSEYPEVTFAPRSYQGTLAPSGDSTIQVSGVFTLHGTPHDLTVPMHIHIEGANMTASGSFAVPYVKWGLKDPSILFLKVAKVVGIDLSLAGTVAPAH
jgi:polyisoprenoid-binding protein YceI